MATIEISTLDPEKTVVVATGNAHKLTEIEAILGQIMDGCRFVALGDLGDFEDPVEDGETFLDNALIKARTALAQTGLAMAVGVVMFLILAIITCFYFYLDKKIEKA